MLNSILRGSLLPSKNQAWWWLDKLLLIIICAIVWGLIAIRPPSVESINVYHGAEMLTPYDWSTHGRGHGRNVGNFLAYALMWNPLGLVQPGQIILVGVLGVFIWKIFVQEPMWVRVVLGGLFVFGFPYLPHGMDRPWAGIYGPSALMFGLLLNQVARGSQYRAINHILTAFLVVLLVLSYETWMMFLIGMSIVTLVAKFAPGLFGRLPIYRMSDWQCVSIGLALIGCLLLRVFSAEAKLGLGAFTTRLTPATLLQLCIVTTRVCMNMLVDSLPLGVIIGFGIMRSPQRFTFSRLGLWPYLLFGSLFSAVGVNFVYGLVLGGVIDWRSRFLIMLMLTAFYCSLPWESISKWLRAHTGMYFDNTIRIAIAAASIKLVYTAVLTFMVHPLNLVGWVDYRARIWAKDASVLEELTDFGSCDNKYCFTEYRSHAVHQLAMDYWADGPTAYVVPWLKIDALRVD